MRDAEAKSKPYTGTREHLADQVTTCTIQYERAIANVSKRRNDLNDAVDRLARYDQEHTEGQTCSPTPTPSSD